MTTTRYTLEDAQASNFAHVRAAARYMDEAEGNLVEAIRAAKKAEGLTSNAAWWLARFGFAEGMS